MKVILLSKDTKDTREKSFWRIVIPDLILEELTEHLKSGRPLETHAFLFGGFDSNRQIITVGRIRKTPEDAYEERSPVYINLKEEYVIDSLEYARRNGFAILDVHMHVGPIAAFFSSLDETSGKENGDWIREVLNEAGVKEDIPWGMVVMDERGARKAAIYDFQRRVFEEAFLNSPSELNGQANISFVEDFKERERLDRQLRIWGEEKQRTISSLKVAVVGCGGTGCIICEQLARIGVFDFSLFDDDKVEKTNLNRLIGAYEKDIGRYKTDVISDAIKRVNPDARVTVFHEGISRNNLNKLVGHSLIIGTVDRSSSRLYLNEASIRYLIPYIDIGTGIGIDEDGCVEEIGGQVIFVNPGTTPCLRCYDGFIDSREIAIDLLTDEELRVRRQLGYVEGTNESPTAAVLPLNSAVVSVAMMELLSLATGFVSKHAYIHFNAKDFRIDILDEEMELKPNKSCPACGIGGFLGLSDIPEQKYVTESEIRELSTLSLKEKLVSTNIISKEEPATVRVKELAEESEEVNIPVEVVSNLKRERISKRPGILKLILVDGIAPFYLLTRGFWRAIRRIRSGGRR